MYFAYPKQKPGYIAKLCIELVMVPITWGISLMSHIELWKNITLPTATIDAYAVNTLHIFRYV